jgi:4,5-dihydroxyphthalate decarboxylase
MLKTLMGEHPVTKQFLTRTDKFDFAQVKGNSAAQHFKRVVRNHEFDVAEMAIMTYIIGKAHGVPYRLLPFVVMARFQHPYLVYNSERGDLRPEDLHRKRIGVRSYSVTTGAWIRGILMDDYGIDISKIRWVTFEEAHVAQFKDPPNVERAPAGKDLNGMLLAGEIDAAIVAAVPPADPRLKTVIRDPEAAAKRWAEKHKAVQLNHLVVVRSSMPKTQSDEVYKLLVESKKAAGDPPMLPHGVEANRRNFEVAIDCAYKQRLVPGRFSVEELFE